MNMQKQQNYKQGKLKDGDILRQQQSNLFFQHILRIHSHRYFRKVLFIIICIHLLTFISPFTNFVLEIPAIIGYIFKQSYNLWPFPTFTVTSSENQLQIMNLIYKILEIVVQLLYTIDLLPKIFIWKKPLWWKCLNVLVVTLMVILVPFTMREYQLYGYSIEKLKFRVCSIGLSFLLLCEIMSIREWKTIKFQQLKKKYYQNEQKKVEKPEYRVYTWPEIIQHDKREDCWVVIEGKVYDISNFINQHPGGDMILDGAGGECTFMWHSYHPSWMLEKRLQDEFLIGEVYNYNDFYSYQSKFYLNIKKQIETKVPRSSRQNDIRLFLKSAIILIAYLYFYYKFVESNTILYVIVFGFLSGQVGVNIMHDGNHMSFSSNKTLSKLAGYTLDLICSSSVVYRRSHNFGHHGCVNHYELDRSFDTTFPLIRLHKMQPKLWFHKYQQIYVWFIYGLTNFGDLFGTFDELYWMSNYPTRQGFCSYTQILLQVIVKIKLFIVQIAIPSYLHGYVHAFPMWMLQMVVFSYSYALFFAVNHWTDEASFTDNTNINNTDWGVIQIQNSCNFGMDSTFWTHLCGGLNYQIEHHLAPGYSHTRLSQISSVVQEYCKEHGIKYFTYKSFWAALAGHYKLLKMLGENE